MSEYFTRNKYTYIYLYIFIYIYMSICFFNLVANEKQLILRYDSNKDNIREWKFKLDLKAEGGLDLYNIIKAKGTIELDFKIGTNVLRFDYKEDQSFAPLLSYSDPNKKNEFEIGDIAFNSTSLIIYIKSHSSPSHKIGNIITKGFSKDEINSLADKKKRKRIKLKLLLGYTIAEMNKRIAEMNKRIIIIIIIGLSLLIVFIITKIINL